MVRIHPDPPVRRQGQDNRKQSVVADMRHWLAFATSSLWFPTPESGAVAQLGERLLCKQEVIGSIPFSSTKQQQRSAIRHRQRHLSVAAALGDEFWQQSSSPRVALFFNNSEGKASTGLDESLVDEGLSCILPAVFKRGWRVAQTHS
jgi:hypothetical protein